MGEYVRVRTIVRTLCCWPGFPIAPAHFLIGRSICLVPMGILELVVFSLLTCCRVVCRCQMPLSSRASSRERRWWLEYQFRVYYSEMFSQGFFTGNALDRQRQRGERHKSRAKEYQRWSSPAVDTRPSLNSAAFKINIKKIYIYIYSPIKLVPSKTSSKTIPVSPVSNLTAN
jgi:hypothetical protein